MDSVADTAGTTLLEARDPACSKHLHKVGHGSPSSPGTRAHGPPGCRCSGWGRDMAAFLAQDPFLQGWRRECAGCQVTDAAVKLLCLSWLVLKIPDWERLSSRGSMYLVLLIIQEGKLGNGSSSSWGTHGNADHTAGSCLKLCETPQVWALFTPRPRTCLTSPTSLPHRHLYFQLPNYTGHRIWMIQYNILQACHICRNRTAHCFVGALEEPLIRANIRETIMKEHPCTYRQQESKKILIFSSGTADQLQEAFCSSIQWSSCELSMAGICHPHTMIMIEVLRSAQR